MDEQIREWRAAYLDYRQSRYEALMAERGWSPDRACAGAWEDHRAVVGQMNREEGFWP